MSLPPSPTVALAVSDLKARYFQYLDNKQWDRLRELYTPDATFEGYAFDDAASAEEFIGTVSAFLKDVRSQHQGFMPRFTSIGDHVRGIWSMHDYLTWEPGSRIYKGIELPGMYGLRGYGYYEDEYAPTDEGWRICFSRLVRTRIDPLVGVPPQAPNYQMLDPDPGWLEA
ncbi:nuclear transport factor 2 family protein [Intrasporangium calvum]|uniref:Nuclear transport factor 2 family protein n=1 Tax=Intrasporangium calvum TaxID=53358 RepID=A0ABT5GE43_9MICO|nr:nuclear transport factor 2 family protein [Intrasporangium calvum]MDC5696524.1 nuclear transport factor 2 family protein [Intrasporangium calvum]